MSTPKSSVILERLTYSTMHWSCIGSMFLARFNVTLHCRDRRWGVLFRGSWDSSTSTCIQAENKTLLLKESSKCFGLNTGSTIMRIPGLHLAGTLLVWCCALLYSTQAYSCHEGLQDNNMEALARRDYFYVGGQYVQTTLVCDFPTSTIDGSTCEAVD